MTEFFDPQESLAQQKAINRERRRAAGETMTREDAEMRYDDIWRWVRTALFFGTGLFGMLVGGTFALTPVGMLLAFFGTPLAIYLGWLYGAAGWQVTRNLWPSLSEKAEATGFLLAGLALAFCGFLAASPGATMSGVSIAVLYRVWEKWAQRQMAKTDFAKLGPVANDTAPPQLIE